jgi:multidrug efflux system outer membrane protein
MVGQVAATYVQLRAAEEQLDMTRSVLARLNGELQEIKAASPPPAITITAPLETILVQLEAGIPLLQGVIEESENTIRLLCAKPDLQLKKNIALSQLHSPLMPKSISSEFIRRRPDVMQAEQILIAQNAMVGVAQSAYFPQLPLTIGRGIGLSALAAIPGSSVSGSVVAASASVMGPILDVGAVEANVSAAQAAKQEAILNYRNTLLKAYLDARTAIVRYNYSGQTVAAYEKALAANQTALGKVRDELKKDPAQVATMLALEQQEFVNRQSLITARVAQVNSLIQIYLSLGGPWIDVWARRGLAFYKDTASEATK